MRPVVGLFSIRPLTFTRRSHEPELALFSPKGPMHSYRLLSKALLGAAGRATGSRVEFLGSEGVGTTRCIFEIGHGQEKDAKNLFARNTRWRFVGSTKDHNSLVRCLEFDLASADAS